MSDWRALLCSEHPETRHQTSQAGGEEDYGHIPTENLCCSSAQFLPVSSLSLVNTVTGNILEAPEQKLTVCDLKLHSILSKKEGEAAKNFDRSQENSYKNPGADPGKWGTDFHIDSREESVRKSIMRFLSGFESMLSENLEKITAVTVTAI